MGGEEGWGKRRPQSRAGCGHEEFPLVKKEGILKCWDLLSNLKSFLSVFNTSEPRVASRGWRQAGGGRPPNLRQCPAVRPQQKAAWRAQDTRGPPAIPYSQVTLHDFLWDGLGLSHFGY